MKLFLILIILLFEVSEDAARSRKCFSTIAGYCKKKCMLGEIYDKPCTKGKLCCINESKKKTHQQAVQQPEPASKPDLKLDYVILPTVTLGTIPQ
ncbi:Beta-defensin 128 [Bos mutus]|uniref:Beta-defensin n=2 Tax=Bos TaxID=9903 RepID=L8J1K3_9CETA|nr:Beta-defensin 128 [Bos mutus]